MQTQAHHVFVNAKYVEILDVHVIDSPEFIGKILF
jgi:hypothetical protein